MSAESSQWRKLKQPSEKNGPNLTVFRWRGKPSSSRSACQANILASKEKVVQISLLAVLREMKTRVRSVTTCGLRRLR